MQNLTEIPSSEKLVDSRARINNNFVSVQSNFSGTAFPTLSIEVGQTCFRTDLAQKFELKSVNPDVWICIADLTKTYTNQEYVDQQDALKANKDAPTFTGTVVLPSTTSIGNVTSTEIGYLDGVTSAIQTQIAGKSSNSHVHVKSDISDFPSIATQAEAETGTEDTKIMTAKKVKDSVLANTVGGQYIGTASIKAISYNAQSIAENITIPSTANAYSCGPITITETFAVTITDGGNWTIF